MQALVNTFQNVRIKSLRAVEKYEIQCFGKIVRERLQGIAFAYLYEVHELSLGEILARVRYLRRLELCGDNPAAAVISKSGSQIDCRHTVRGAELQDGLRPGRARKHVEQRSCFA